ncbi:hypothetical protein GCM10025858_05430 [Alicyclobacillus sacchari]|nr:hypothetical protein GCM10025858_05430 [Alicyclobacillus sacchari]
MNMTLWPVHAFVDGLAAAGAAGGRFTRFPEHAVAAGMCGTPADRTAVPP